IKSFGHGWEPGCLVGGKNESYGDAQWVIAVDAWDGAERGRASACETSAGVRRPDQAASHLRPGSIAGRQMGGVRNFDAGHGNESGSQQHLARGHIGRRCDPVDAEWQRFGAIMVTGRENVGVSVGTRWHFAGVRNFHGRRRSEEADDAVDGSGFVQMVTGWQEHRVYVWGVRRL